MTSPGKLQVTLMTLGDFDHGRTTLSAAINKVQADKGLAELKSYDKIDKAKDKRENGVTIFSTTVEYETENRHYNLIDCRGHVDIVKKMIAGPEQIDGAILVVSAPDGPGPQTREHVRLALQAGVGYIVVFLNKLDLMDPDDNDMVELVEFEIRDLLTYYEYSNDDFPVPIVRGSALKALEGDEESGVEITELLGKLDQYILTSQRAEDKFFLMPVENLKDAVGGKRVVGKIMQGVVKTDDFVVFIDTEETTDLWKVRAIEIAGNLDDRGKAGDNVGLFFQEVTIADVWPGIVVAEPYKFKPYTKFKALVYFLTQKEGGYDKSKSISSDFRPEFNIYFKDRTGSIKLPEGTEKMAAGEHGMVEVTLDNSVAMYEGLYFAIRAEGRTIGVGTIKNIRED